MPDYRNYYNGTEYVQIATNSQFDTPEHLHFDILRKLSKGYEKMAALDEWERLADWQLSRGVINQEKRLTIGELIDRHRELAEVLLQKEEGTYKTPAQVAREERQAQKDYEKQLNFIESLRVERAEKIKKGLKFACLGVCLCVCLAVPKASVVIAFVVICYLKRR